MSRGTQLDRRIRRGVIVLGLLAALMPIMPTQSRAAVGDTPPTWSNGATIGVSVVTPSSATLSWPAAFDDAAVAGYRLYDGSGTFIDATAETSYTLNGLSPDTSYTVRVEAYDGDGNESTQLTGLNYGPRLGLTAGDSPHSIDIEDLNHDGDLDLAIAVRGDHSASILLGNGDGTFGSASLYSVGTAGGVGPKNLAFGYFNADSHIDIVSANQDSGTAGVILGNGDGTFGAVTPYATLYGTHDVAVGDFDNNGDDDFMVVGWGTELGTIWYGNGDGTFSNPATYAAGTESHGIVVADFDNNGDLDVAAAANNNSAAAVMAGNGDGSLEPPVLYTGSSNGWAHDIAMGDFNEDGDEDLVIAGENTDDLSVFFGGSGTTFSSNTPYTVADEPKGVSVGDLDSDGHQDLIGTSVVGNYPGCPTGSGDPLTFWMGDGSGGFSSGGSVNVGVAPFDAAVADFNGDGWNDLAAPSWCDNTVSIFLSLGEGGPTTTFQTVSAGSEPTEPGAPATPTVTPGDGSASVSWSTPFDGGSAILNYDLQLNNQTAGGNTITDVGLTLSETLTDLTNGYTYRVRVRAANAIGNGGWSNWSATFVPDVPPTEPGAPGTPVLAAGNGSFTADWTGPADDGGAAITFYELDIDDLTAGTGWIDNVGLTLSEYVGGLVNGSTYRARARATNSVGAGPWSAWSGSVTPESAPDAPGKPLVAAGSGEVTIDWQQPFDGGATITSYELELEDESDGSSLFIDPGLDLTEAVTGLIDGHPYRARVRAENGNGWSGWSAWSDSAVPGSTPGAPGSPTLVAGAAEADAAWAVPNDDGGSAITGYEVQVEDQTTATSTYVELGPGLATTLTGLTNGDTYRVRVRAINVDGRGSWSGWSPSAIPSTVAGAPGLPGIVAGNRVVTATWAAPSDDGGAPVTGYQLKLEDVTVGTSTVTDVGLVLAKTVSGLSGGDAYRARVRAANGNGWGSWSAWSSTAVPEGDTFSDDDASIFEADIAAIRLPTIVSARITR